MEYRVDVFANIDMRFSLLVQADNPVMAQDEALERARNLRLQAFVPTQDGQDVVMLTGLPFHRIALRIGSVTVQTCEVCDQQWPRIPGVRLSDNDEHGLRFEKCDTCERYASDDEASRAVLEYIKHTELGR